MGGELRELSTHGLESGRLRKGGGWRARITKIDAVRQRGESGGGDIPRLELLGSDLFFRSRIENGGDKTLSLLRGMNFVNRKKITRRKNGSRG